MAISRKTRNREATIRSEPFDWKTGFRASWYYFWSDHLEIPAMIVEILRQRVQTRVSGLLGDLGLFDAALEALSKQSRVAKWVREVFTEKEAHDVPERALRMVEEAIELAQACEVDAATLHRLVDYVMGRSVGRQGAEIAGTMVTLYALASAVGCDADLEFEIELKRIAQPEVIDRCRRRQHEKREALASSFRCTQCGEAAASLSDNLCNRCVKKWAHMTGDLVVPVSQTAELAELKARLKRTEAQLAGCGVAALDGSAEQEAKVDDYGWSASYMEVLKIRRELEMLRARTSVTGDQTDAVRYALRDAFEQQIDRCGGVVPVRSLPDETVSETFLKVLAERGLSVTPTPSSTSPIEDFCDAQLGTVGSLR